MHSYTYVIELSQAERDFLLYVVDAGFKALGVNTLVSKLKVIPRKDIAPAEEPA